MIEINKEALYKALVDLWVSYCATCLDKHQKEKMMLCDLKMLLLNYAIDNNLENEALQHYADLCRLLNIPVDNKYIGKLGNCNCQNGLCCCCKNK